MSQVGTGRFDNLTPDIPPLTAPGHLLRSLGFSGDGAEIWFNPAGNPGQRQGAHAADGGTPRPFLGEGARRSVLVSRRHPPRLLRRTRVGGDPLSDRRPHGRGRPSDRRATRHGAFFRKACTTTIRSGHQTASGSTSCTGRTRPSEMDVWRMRPSGGSPEQTDAAAAHAVNFLAPLDARTLLYVARAEDWSGPWLWALDVETQGHAPRDRRASSNTRRCRPVATAGAWSPPWPTPPPACGACRLLDRLAEDRDVEPYPVPTERALAPRFGGTSLFYLSSAAGPATGSGGFRTGRRPKSGRAPTGRCPSRPRCRRTAAAWRSSSDRRGSGTCRSCRRTARTRERWRRPSTSRAAGQGTADWSPDGDWIVTGGSDAQGPGLVQDPGGWRRARAARRRAGGQSGLVADGDLIVYAATAVGGAGADCSGCDRMARLSSCRPVRVRPGGYRFLPQRNGPGVPAAQPVPGLLAARSRHEETRQLTHLSDHGALQTFDITPDGKHIVFDRSRQNSDIVLIDLPK